MCQMLILDEADRLLDMGFMKALDEILRYVAEAPTSAGNDHT